MVVVGRGAGRGAGTEVMIGCCCCPLFIWGRCATADPFIWTCPLGGGGAMGCWSSSTGGAAGRGAMPGMPPFICPGGGGGCSVWAWAPPDRVTTTGGGGGWGCCMRLPAAADPRSCGIIAVGSLTAMGAAGGG